MGGGGHRPAAGGRPLPGQDQAGGHHPSLAEAVGCDAPAAECGVAAACNDLAVVWIDCAARDLAHGVVPPPIPVDAPDWQRALAAVTYSTEQNLAHSADAHLSVEEAFGGGPELYIG